MGERMEESVGRRKRVTVALCGFGRAGRIHFNSIRRNHRCHLKYIVDVFGNSDVLKFARDKLQEYYLLDTVALVEASDFESIVLADATVDAVVITVPTPLHESYVRSSLTAKKAVFCEKPLAFDVKDAASFYDLAAQNESPLFCSFQRRFDRGMVKLKRQVADGNVGQVYHLKTTSRDSPRPTIDYMKSSGHIFHDTAVHDLDYICWVIGEDPVEVFAQGSTFDPEIRAIGDFDTILISLKFPSGALATTDISRHSTYGYDMRIEVHGKKGMMICENALSDPTLTYNESGCLISPMHYSFPQRFKEAYEHAMDHFVDLVLDPSLPCAVTKREVVLNTLLANACKRSLKEKKIVTFKMPDY